MVLFIVTPPYFFLLITLQRLKVMVVYICYYKEPDSFRPRNGTLSGICGMDKLVYICEERANGYLNMSCTPWKSHVNKL